MKRGIVKWEHQRFIEIIKHQYRINEAMEQSFDRYKKFQSTPYDKRIDELNEALTVFSKMLGRARINLDWDDEKTIHSQIGERIRLLFWLQEKKMALEFVQAELEYFSSELSKRITSEFYVKGPSIKETYNAYFCVINEMIKILDARVTKFMRELLAYNPEMWKVTRKTLLLFDESRI